MFAHADECMYAGMYVCMYVCVCVCMCVCMYVCMCVRMYVCAYHGMYRSKKISTVQYNAILQNVSYNDIKAYKSA